MKRFYLSLLVVIVMTTLMVTGCATTSSTPTEEISWECQIFWDWELEIEGYGIIFEGFDTMNSKIRRAIIPLKSKTGMLIPNDDNWDFSVEIDENRLNDGYFEDLKEVTSSKNWYGNFKIKILSGKYTGQIYWVEGVEGSKSSSSILFEFEDENLIFKNIKLKI